MSPRRQHDMLHINAVADLLGHSSISITGDIYGHRADATTRAAIGWAVSGARAVACPRAGEGRRAANTVGSV